MMMHDHSKLFNYVFFGFVLLCCLLVSLSYVPESSGPSFYLPHRYCLNNGPLLVVHVLCDFIIGTCYFIIPSLLIKFTFRIKQAYPELMHYRWVFFGFACFILSCGMTHFVEVLTLWIPIYKFSALVKMICATASLSTAASLPRVADYIEKRFVSGQGG